MVTITQARTGLVGAGLALVALVVACGEVAGVRNLDEQGGAGGATGVQGQGGRAEGGGAAGRGEQGAAGAAGRGEQGAAGAAGGAGGGASGGGASGGGGSSGGELDLCLKCVSDPAVLYVSGAVGDDAVGDGSCTKPVLTIRQGLALAASSAVVRIVRLLARPDGTALTYAAATNGETFPVDVSVPGVTVEGCARSVVTISGSADCGVGDTGSCAIRLSKSSRLLNLTVTSNQKGAGVRALAGKFDAEASKPTLDRVLVVNSKPGVVAVGANSVRIIDSELARNEVGVLVTGEGNGADLVMRRSKVRLNSIAGAQAVQDSFLFLEANEFAENTGSGVVFRGNVPLTSRGDHFTANAQHGIFFEGFDGSCGTACRLDAAGSFFEANGASGVAVGGLATLKVRGSTFRDNGANQLSILAFVTNVDLGQAGDAGGNVFLAGNNPDAVKVCFNLNDPNATTTATSVGNAFPACPPTRVATCNEAGDVGGNHADDLAFEACTKSR